MLLKAVGQPKGIGKPLGNAQRLLESLWSSLEGYQKAAGKCPNTLHQPIGEEAQLPSSCGKNMVIFFLFLKLTFLFIFFKN
jgi:hypothetical protein